jgi:hypothetical protein
VRAVGMSCGRRHYRRSVHLDHEQTPSIDEHERNRNWKPVA